MTKQFLVQVEMEPGSHERPGWKQGAELFKVAIDQAYEQAVDGPAPNVKVIELLDAEDLNVESINTGIVDYKRRGGQLSVATLPDYDFDGKYQEDDGSKK